MPVLTKSGRVVIAESIAARPLHLAWGVGDGAWLTPPSESVAATALIGEIGRRAVSEVAYVVPDNNGEIVIPTGRFSRSVVPTSNLYLRFSFDFNDAPSAVIREIGVFVGSVPVAGLPPGQAYFTPDQIATPGRMLNLENIAPLYRSPVIRESNEVVISF